MRSVEPHRSPEEIDAMIPRDLNAEELREIAQLDADPDSDDSEEERQRDIERATEARRRIAAGPAPESWQRVPADKLRSLTQDADDVIRTRAIFESNRRRAEASPASLRPGHRAQWVDLIEIPDEDPPMALAPLMLDEGPSVLFGMGESRKSIIAQIVATSLATGHEIIPGWQPTVTGPVMWLDYENGRRRLARRQRLLGHPEASILYVPCIRPIWDEAAELEELARVEGIVAVIIDSIIPATSGGGLSAKDAETAGRYFAAVNAIAPRSLSLAHVTKDGEGSMPFGSVFYGNLARLTWRSRADDQGRVTLTNEKHTDGDRLPPMTLAFDWDEPLTVTHTTSQLTPTILGEIVANVGTVTARGLADAVRAAGYTAGRSWLHLLAGRAVAEGHLTRPSRGRYGSATGTDRGLTVDYGVLDPGPKAWTNGGQPIPSPLIERVD